jgi:putative transposase
MKRRAALEERVRIVREAEAELGQGVPVEEVCRKHQVGQSTLFRWRRQYGGLTTSEAKEFKALKQENSSLKSIVAELELDKRILQEAVKRLGKV